MNSGEKNKNNGKRKKGNLESNKNSSGSKNMRDSNRVSHL